MFDKWLEHPVDLAHNCRVIDCEHFTKRIPLHLRISDATLFKTCTKITFEDAAAREFGNSYWAPTTQ